jgi:hypothetical protein
VGVWSISNSVGLKTVSLHDEESEALRWSDCAKTPCFAVVGDILDFDRRTVIDNGIMGSFRMLKEARRQQQASLGNGIDQL